MSGVRPQPITCQGLPFLIEQSDLIGRGRTPDMTEVTELLVSYVKFVRLRMAAKVPGTMLDTGIRKLCTAINKDDTFQPSLLLSRQLLHADCTI